jgi:hypothetical protein
VTRAAVRGLGVVLLALLAGCLGGGKPDTPPAELARPSWQVGDQWVFRRTSTSSLGGVATLVRHEVMEAGPEGYTVRVTRLRQEYTRRWTPELHLVSQPARYFDWPLSPGKTWTQTFTYTDAQGEGRYANTWKVDLARVDVLAGQFVALKVERFGGANEPLDSYWYVPPVRYWVRFDDHVNQYVEELIEFRRGLP